MAMTKREEFLLKLCLQAYSCMGHYEITGGLHPEWDACMEKLDAEYKKACGAVPKLEDQDE